MLIEANGISVEADVRGNRLSYRVVEQSKEATDILRYLGHIRDDETGFSLRSNEKPSYNKKTRRFFLRGTEHDHNNREVVASFATEAEARRALAALDKLIKSASKPDNIVDVEHSHGVVKPGGTSHFRFHFINRAMATHLQLTGHKLYPKEILDWEYTEPIRTVNRHYTEHAMQCTDAMNKTLLDDNEQTNSKGVINPHRVTPRQAKAALAAWRKIFQDAYENDYLVALWRIATFGRGPDDMENDNISKYHKKDVAKHP